MRPEHITLIVLAVAVLLLGGFEVYALLNDKPGDTISEVISWLTKHPLATLLFGFGLGLLIGHWFWPMYTHD